MEAPAQRKGRADTVTVLREGRRSPWLGAPPRHSVWSPVVPSSPGSSYRPALRDQATTSCQTELRALVAPG